MYTLLLIVSFCISRHTRLTSYEHYERSKSDSSIEVFTSCYVTVDDILSACYPKTMRVNLVLLWSRHYEGGRSSDSGRCLKTVVRQADDLWPLFIRLLCCSCDAEYGATLGRWVERKWQHEYSLKSAWQPSTEFRSEYIATSISQCGMLPMNHDCAH